MKIHKENSGYAGQSIVFKPSFVFVVVLQKRGSFVSWHVKFNILQDCNKSHTGFNV